MGNLTKKKFNKNLEMKVLLFCFFKGEKQKDCFFSLLFFSGCGLDEIFSVFKNLLETFQIKIEKSLFLDQEKVSRIIHNDI